MNNNNEAKCSSCLIQLNAQNDRKQNYSPYLTNEETEFLDDLSNE